MQISRRDELAHIEPGVSMLQKVTGPRNERRTNITIGFLRKPMNVTTMD